MFSFFRNLFEWFGTYYPRAFCESDKHKPSRLPFHVELDAQHRKGLQNAVKVESVLESY